MKGKGIVFLVVAMLLSSFQFAHANWILTFSDEFNGTGLDTSKWQTPYPGGGHAGSGTGEQEYYVDNAFNFPASGASGYLQINTSQLTQPWFQCLNGTCLYTSGLINTQSHFGQSYGYFEMRAKLPAGQGLWPAFWLMPGDMYSYSWTTGYEIDVMEVGGKNPSIDYMNLHYPGGQYMSSTAAGGDLSAGFHTFAVDWEPGVITWYLDGAQRKQVTSNVPSIPMYLIADLAIGGSWSAIGYPDSATQTKIANDAVPMQIDYIRVYQKTPSGGYTSIPGPAPVPPYLGNNPTSLPQTGQNFCVQPGTQTLVPCSGTGQDGETQQGTAWPAPRFSVNTDTTLTDRLTGLIWGNDADASPLASCSGGTLSWQGTLDYVSCLNSNNYLGHNDWRLPNINELTTLLNRGEQPGLSWLSDYGFSNLQAGGNYASSTTGADLPTAAYSFTNAYSYDLHLLDKVGNLFIAWPVRGGQNGASDPTFPANVPQTGQTVCYDSGGSVIPCAGTGQDGEKQYGVVWPSQRFTSNVDTTLTDKLTALTWAPDAGTPAFTPCTGGVQPWQDALAYVACLNANVYLNQIDWRLPNTAELQSLINFGKTSADNWYGGLGFVNTLPQRYYWTSDTVAGSPYIGNLLSDGFNLMGASLPISTADILPVRGGSSFHGVPAAVVAPSSITFAPVTAGSSGVAQTFTVTNSGTNLLTIAGVALSGGNPADFAISGDVCSGTTLAPGVSCTVNAAFAPASDGSKVAYLTVTSNGAPVLASLSGSAAHSLSLSFTGTGSGTVAGTTTGIPVALSFSASNSLAISTGAVVTLTPKPASGSNFGLWSGCDSVNGTICTLTMASDRSVTAQFSITTYTVTFSAGSGGSLLGTTSQTVNNGQSTTPVTATAANGYHFVNWTDAGNKVVSSANPLTVANVTANMALTANFALNTVVVLSLSKSHVGNFYQGQTGATYTITTSNRGSGPTTGTVMVTDTLPGGLTATGIKGSGWACSLSTLTCTNSNVLNAGSSLPSITLTVNVAANAPTSVTNVAAVAGGGQFNTSSSTANDATNIVAAPDLTIVKSHNGNFSRGQIGARYTVAVSNKGTAPTSGMVTVTDTLPSGLTATAISGSGWTCTLSTRSCIRRDSLAAGSSYPSITLTVNVSRNASSLVINIATVSGGGEVNTSNDTARDTTSIF